MKIKNEHGHFGQPANLLEGKEYFFLRSNRAYQQIRYVDILYCESLPSGYCRVVTKKETYVHYNTLKGLQEFLPSNRFCRIHAGFIVGIDHIAWFHETSLSLHEPDPSYKKGFAWRRDFKIGIRYLKGMRVHLLAASSHRGGQYRAIKLRADQVLQEMEWEED